MKQVGIYGGSFNPIHNGHVELAKQILQQTNLDEIWFMVSPLNPLKRQVDLLDDELRLEMVRLALQDHPRLIASDYEFGLPTPSYTWNTLQALTRDFPQTAFTLIFGADNWAVFDQWAHHQDILNNYHIAIYPRRHSPIDAATLPSNVHLLNTPLYDISSTEIRKRIRCGQSVKHLIPQQIHAPALKYYGRPAVGSDL